MLNTVLQPVLLGALALMTACVTAQAQPMADSPQAATAFPDAKSLQKKKNLGRLKAVATEGDIDGDHDAIVAFGVRSFSIWNADTGEQVFDSGDDFERITAEALGTAGFNATDDENGFDDRSDDKGPEPEALEHIRFKLHDNGILPELPRHSHTHLRQETRSLGSIYVPRPPDPRHPSH